MATLLAIGYADQGVAEVAQKSIQELGDEFALTADQVASVGRDVKGRYHAHISHGRTTTTGGGDWGCFWSALFGLMFFGPSAHVALRSQRRGNPGVQNLDRGFQDRVREQLKPGTSAVFLMIEHATSAKIVVVLQRYGGTTHEISLSNAELARVRARLSDS